MQEENLALRLGAAIRTVRLATGLSQEGFADAISMHRAYYSAIKRGEKNITIGTLGPVNTSEAHQRSAQS
ncbi:helix-turn-helix transcriptional regulator [Xanthomonas floridensis]|uniref:Helix-turn-helix transcriptional regulator n=1 Tax=Xanthomonas floridensis TaxID=1843580 RepID=A0ABU5Q3T0_9XANT|nr:helix-turn-helix transcriptional regulator [Xanthomonas floridensis]MEA5126543.1 helix-turn-helix transcriptional regulator [Xanthomonas floridensis]